MTYTERPIQLNDEERATIERLSSDRSVPQRIRRRALAVLLMDQGLTGVEISRRTGFAQMHVSKLRRRFWDEGLAGLRDRRSPVRSVDKSKLPPGRRARPVVLQHHEKAQLRRLSKDPKTPPHIGCRARALLLMSEGARNTEVSRQVGYTIQYLSNLRRRFARERMRLVAHPRIPSGGSPSWPEMSNEDSAMTRQPKTWPVELLRSNGDCEGWIIESWQPRKGQWFTKLRDTELQGIGSMQKDGGLTLKDYMGEGATEREAVGDMLEAIKSYLSEKQRGWSARLV